MLDGVPDVRLVAAIFTTQSSSSPIHFSISFSVLLISSSVFFISIIVFTSVQLFFIFSLLKNSDFSFSLCIHFLSNSFPHLYDPTVNFFSGRLLVSSSLSSSFGVLSFSFIWNILLWCLRSLYCLYWYLYFCVCGSFVSFLDFGVTTFCRGCLSCSSSALSFCYLSHKPA